MSLPSRTPRVPDHGPRPADRGGWWPAWGWVVVATLLATAGILYFVLHFLDARRAPAIVLEDPRAGATIVVMVEGRVATPGLYALPSGARVQDAVESAGGFLPDTDLARVNPAARLDDEQRVVVPAIGEDLSAAPVVAIDASGGERVANSPAVISELININTATAAELELLPEIGPTRAAAIVAYREEHGPFTAIDDLTQVEGTSASVVETIRPLVTLGP